MTAFRRLLIALGSLPVSPWLGRRIFAWLDATLRASPVAPSRLASMPLCVLTTTGHRSGQGHSVPLWHVPAEGASDTVVVASNFGSHRHPAWAYNLDADPGATLESSNTLQRVRARRVSDDEFARYWPRFVEIWPHYQRYRDQTDRAIRMYLLERQPSADA